MSGEVATRIQLLLAGRRARQIDIPMNKKMNDAPLASENGH